VHGSFAKIFQRYPALSGVLALAIPALSAQRTIFPTMRGWAENESPGRSGKGLRGRSKRHPAVSKTPATRQPDPVERRNGDALSAGVQALVRTGQLRYSGAPEGRSGCPRGPGSGNEFTSTFTARDLGVAARDGG